MRTLLLFPGQPNLRVQTILLLTIVLCLTNAFWVATIPAAITPALSPKEMIEAGLPPGVMIKTAGKPQFLTAVCAAVKNHRSASPAIAKAAVAAHSEYAGDIVTTVVRCANGTCELTGAIVAAAIAAAPDSAPVIDDAAVAVAPDCADAIEKPGVPRDGKEILGDGKEVLPGEDVPAEGPAGFTGSPPVSQPPFFLPGGGGGFSPDNVVVCDNGRQRNVSSDRLAHFLATHPGSFVGTCQITPTTSR